jgi:hypothetical protein
MGNWFAILVGILLTLLGGTFGIFGVSDWGLLVVGLLIVIITGFDYVLGSKPPKNR